jgi:two-component system, OmpR family, KDP operon response regulator KdpE
MCRQIHDSTKAPLIILGTSDKTAYEIQCLNLGADDYIAKPINVDELIARITVALRHSKSGRNIPREAPFICGDIKIDFQKRQLSVVNREVKLMPTEYNLLVELVTNTDRVLTFQELLSKIWGNEYAGDRGYLYVQISHLREKLERDPKNPRYIISVSRVGYKFQT